MGRILGITNTLCELDDIGLYAGDEQPIEVPVYDRDRKTVPLDTVIVRFMICDYMDDSVVYLTKIGTHDEGSYIAIINLETNDTKDIPQDKYRMIIEVEYNTGNKNIGKGLITIL